MIFDDVQNNLADMTYRAGRLVNYIETCAKEGYAGHIDDVTHNLLEMIGAALDGYEAAGGNVVELRRRIVAEFTGDEERE